ncbi:antibiotic biosynthesis monooxygenase [Chryseobacterium sp. StRB126]|uniref:putative quinol monooxygenase n=1 Tax=Chryseobacterium sp. StRB126 TaxID=878220 RepID=UPI0004E98CEE|nr:antibiotic biosynthesis monooxygenase family protein [Chryseobacterium sp. StRB126]BAP33381.1 antibiotic biosynthesis monooxygenase [Chryseobacterium sp. StRB126]
MDIFVKTITENMENKYLLHGRLTAKPGHKEVLADILIQASQLVSTAKGCKLYTVSHDKDDANSVYVTEIWENKDDHDNSLKVEGVRELIMKAMPILDGQPTKGQELEILGGTGI